eukprot:COSAG06_NODE_18552_length_882_cov_0.629630_1_plen_53_part_10
MIPPTFTEFFHQFAGSFCSCPLFITDCLHAALQSLNQLPFPVSIRSFRGLAHH